MGQRLSKKKKAKSSVTSQDRAVLDLKNSRDRLKRYQKRLDGECAKLHEQAGAMLKEGRKDRALLYLKIKKLKQEQANKADAQLISVLQMMDTIDWETQQARVFDALQEGNQALTRLHEEMPLEKVEELMLDTAENIAVHEEISKAIGASWTDANEEDLLKELADIEAEAEAEEAAAIEAQLPPPAVTKIGEKPPAPERQEITGEAGAVSFLEEMLPEAPTGEVPAQAAVEEPERPIAVPA